MMRQMVQEKDEKAVLKGRINVVRELLYHLAVNEDLSSIHVLNLSQELDCLILEYYDSLKFSISAVSKLKR